MKKMLILAAAVATALFAQADSYLYWMLTDTPTSSPTTFKPAGQASEYYASVKISSGTGAGTYLTYGNSSADATLLAANERYQMNLGSSFGSDSSFIIELWAEGATQESYRSGTLSYSDLYAGGFISDGTEKFNTKVLAGSNFGAVPEPTSGMMMLLGAMLLGLKRKKLA